MAWGPKRTRAPGAAVLGALVVVLTVLVLGTWVATIGPREVFQDAGSPSTQGAESQAGPTPTPTPLAEPGGEEAAEADGSPPPGWVRLLALLSQAGAALLAVFLLMRLLAALRRVVLPRRRGWARLSDVDFEVVETDRLDELADAVRDDTDEQRAALAGGTPRNGIVHCWHRFEVQAGAIGLGRSSWETSSEFTLRMLDAVSTDEQAIARLAGLYREARFSDHDVDERDREAAAESLRRIRSSLRTHPTSSLR